MIDILKIHKYDKNCLLVKINKGLLNSWLEEAQVVFPNQATSQKHYVQIAILGLLLYNGNHSTTYHNTYILSGLFKAVTNNYKKILQYHRSIIRTNQWGKPRFEDRFICGYRVELPIIKQCKMATYEIRGSKKLFEMLCSSLFENFEQNNGEMLHTKLEDGIRAMFDCPNEKRFKRILEDVSYFKNQDISDYLSQLMKLTTPIEFDPCITFEQRYSYLYFSNELLAQNIKRSDIPTLLAYLKHLPASHNEEEKYIDDDYNQNRYYHAFHRTPKVLREYVMFNGDKLVEAFDVHQCFYVLMCKLFEKSNGIGYDELMRYEKLVRYGDLYTTIINYITKEMPYVDYKLLCCSKCDARNYIKGEVQRWRNMLPARVESDKGIIRAIDMFYKTYFPSIRDFILHYHTEKQQKKKKRCSVKQIQCDCIKIETDIMSRKVCKRLEQYGVYAITLHDGVYIRECDKAKLFNIGVEVEDIFWQELDLMIDQQPIPQVG